jgi:hypothetical protein
VAIRLVTPTHAPDTEQLTERRRRGSSSFLSEPASKVECTESAAQLEGTLRVIYGAPATAARQWQWLSDPFAGIGSAVNDETQV